jgi:hypothetical protein
MRSKRRKTIKFSIFNNGVCPTSTTSVVVVLQKKQKQKRKIDVFFAA